MSWKHVYKKNLHTNVNSSFVNCQQLETTKCPLVSKWINKLWYIHTRKYYSSIKVNELLSHENTWRNLKYVLLSKRSQPEKAAYYMIPTVWNSGKGQTVETVKRSVVANSCRAGEQNEQVERRGFLRQWTYSAWYFNSG